jgi:hypothetical protein
MANYSIRWRYQLLAAYSALLLRHVLGFSSLEGSSFVIKTPNRSSLPTASAKSWFTSVNNHNKLFTNDHICRSVSNRLRDCTDDEVSGHEFVTNVEMDFSTKDPKRTDKNVGGYDPSERLGGREVNVGDPQLKLQEKEFSVTAILRELKAIQQKGPQKYCILGTRHCSYMHQQIIELL